MKTHEFLKEAFCIDGECVEYGETYLIDGDGKHHKSLTHKLTDSKRGVFLVTLTTLDAK